MRPGKRARGRCSVCGRETALHVNGQLYYHYASGTTRTCEGSLGKPEAAPA